MYFSQLKVELLATYEGLQLATDGKHHVFAWNVTIKHNGRDYVGKYTAGLAHCTRDRFKWAKAAGLPAHAGIRPTFAITLSEDAMGRELARALKPFGPLMLDDCRGLVYPIPPTVDGYLECLQLDARLGEHLLFEDFCSELGEDTDSRKAERCWRACQETRGKLQKLFGSRFDEFMSVTDPD